MLKIKLGFSLTPPCKARAAMDGFPACQGRNVPNLVRLSNTPGFFGSTVRPSAYFQLQKCFIRENLLMMIPAAWDLPCLNLISGALQSAA